LKDDTRRASLLSNTAILLATQVVTKILGTVFTIVVARRLGVESYGLWVFATSLGYMFGMLVTCGLPRLITREVARDLETTPEMLGRVLRVEMVISAVALAAMLVLLVALRYTPARMWIVAVGGAAMLLYAVLDVVTAFFRAHQRMDLEGVVRVGLSGLNVGLGLVVLFAGLGLPALALTQLVAFALALLLGLALVRRKLARPVFSGGWQAYRLLLVAVAPFALSSFFIYVYDGTAVLFLSFMKGDAVTGLYSAATNFIRVFAILPASLVAALLPAMALAWRTSRPEWTRLYRYSLKYLLMMALPISVGLALVGRDIVSLVLGDAYAGSVSILSMAAWVNVFVFLNHGCSNALISMNREKSFLSTVGTVMVFNLAVNPLLISRWGAHGAVAASLLTEGLMLAIQLRVLSRMGATAATDATRSGLALLARQVLSVGLMAVVVCLTRPLGLAGMICLGAAVYTVAIFALRTFDSDEIGSLQRWGASLWARLPGRLRHQLP